MKQIILATVIVLAISSCGNNSNKNNSDMGDTTKVTTLPPATDTMPATDTTMSQNKKKDSANKKAKK